MLAISVGKFEPIKGHVMQLLALEQLMHRPTPNNIHLAWAGTGSLESDLVKCMVDHGLEERVHILGMCGTSPKYLMLQIYSF